MVMVYLWYIIILLSAILAILLVSLLGMFIAQERKAKAKAKSTESYRTASKQAQVVQRLTQSQR